MTSNPKENIMFRKLQFAIMLLPVLAASYLAFQAPTVHGVPAHLVVAFDPFELIDETVADEEVVVASNE